MKRNSKYLIRKAHRYLGLFIGIQFLLWTLGGLYFSWNDIDKVHGDHLRRSVPLLPAGVQPVSPAAALSQLRQQQGVDSLLAVELIAVRQQPVWRIRYLAGGVAGPQTALADATTGQLRGELSREEAVAIAEGLFLPEAVVKEVTYLTEVGNHSEYREKPLPAWAIRFDHPDNPVIYVGAHTGTFETIRHDTWRNFDFLWMLHTMDYESRDEFGNTLLQAFSVLGLITVLSGFVLFYISSPTVRKLKKKINSARG